jgi:hypothetical protein
MGESNSITLKEDYLNTEVPIIYPNGGMVLKSNTFLTEGIELLKGERLQGRRDLVLKEF